MTATPDQMQLKPCPFCGAGNVTPPIEGYEHWVACGSCDTEGPYGDDAAKATEAWNQRDGDAREAALREEVARLAAERDKLAGIVRGWHNYLTGPDEMGDYITERELRAKLAEYAK